MRKKISRIKRGLAVMLSVCMVFGLAPIQAGAEENDSETARNAMQPYISLPLKQLINMILTMTA